jgi:quercetin dioxygenase-like cupin family protein
MEKGVPHNNIEIIEYLPARVVCAIGEEIGKKKIQSLIPYIQIIDGAVELMLNGKKMELKLGEGIIIPANALQGFHAPQHCKMIATIINSGYED